MELKTPKSPVLLTTEKLLFRMQMLKLSPTLQCIEESKNHPKMDTKNVCEEPFPKKFVLRSLQTKFEQNDKSSSLNLEKLAHSLEDIKLGSSDAEPSAGKLNCFPYSQSQLRENLYRSKTLGIPDSSLGNLQACLENSGLEPNHSRKPVSSINWSDEDESPLPRSAVSRQDNKENSLDSLAGMGKPALPCRINWSDEGNDSVHSAVLRQNNKENSYGSLAGCRMKSAIIKTSDVERSRIQNDVMKSVTDGKRSLIKEKNVGIVSTRQPLAEKKDLSVSSDHRLLLQKPYLVTKHAQATVPTYKTGFRNAFTQTDKQKFQPNNYSVNGKSYMVLSKLGQGGSSEVFQVFDPCDSTLKALKIVKLSDSDPVILDSYKNEITRLKTLQKLDRVVKLYDFEFRDKLLLILLEKGDSDLARVLSRKHGSLDPIQIRFYWKEMLQAVNEIHGQGIIHLDLKPANFIQVEGRLKIIDFGISTSVQQDMTSVIKEHQLGTLNYMSPESLQGCHENNQDPSSNKPQFKVRTKSDVWSLSCILHSLVYGRTPFQHITVPFAKINAIINPHLLQFPDLKDNHLLDVFKSCFVCDPVKRPSIEELLAHPYLTSYHQETTRSFELLLSEVRLSNPQQKTEIARALEM